MASTDVSGIKGWAPADQPREKLLTKGKLSLTDAELLAALIGSGNRDRTAVQVAQELLRLANHDLDILGKFSVADMCQVSGIGKVKAISIVSALELGSRRKWKGQGLEPIISDSNSAYKVVRDVFVDMEHEEFWVMLLNRSNKVVKRVQVGKGGVASVTVDVRIILKIAITELASGIILCHNHPSGNLLPSRADLRLTQDVIAAAKLVDIKVLDHLILSDNAYFSFADENRL